jgi:hypothetical protein
MLRPDQRTVWAGFLAAAPCFAGEDFANHREEPDPTDVLCTTTSGNAIGVELTKWVEHDQVTDGRGRERWEKSYLGIIGSENEPRGAYSIDWKRVGTALHSSRCVLRD